METQLKQPSTQAIEQAAELLRAGEIVAIPTETVYGIAASALNQQAVEKIFIAKARPQDNPLIVHIADRDMLPMVTSQFSSQAEKLAEAFWPGPLTMILPRGEQVCDGVCAGLDTVAVRMPSHPVAQQIIRASGLPLAAPSANLSGSPSPTTAAHVLADMQGRLPLIVDGGECQVGLESTVVSLAGERPVLLRPGAVTQQQLEEVLGVSVELAAAVLEQLQEGQKVLSPGMKYKHYAPKAQVTIVKGELGDFARYVAEHKGPDAVCLCFDGEQEQLSLPCVAYGAKEDAVQQAQQLFAALRRLDEIGAVQVFARCPSMEGVGLAVYNRLLRAAGFRVVQV